MATPSILIVPDRYKSGVLYSQLPEDGSGDLTFTRASAATRVNASGLIESVASGVPRLDYPSAGGCPSLLLEPQRTNIVQNSENTSGYSTFGSVFTQNTATSPQGVVNADTIAGNGASTQIFGSTPITFASSGSATISVFAKANNASVVDLNFDAFAGSVSSQGIYDLTNGTASGTGASIQNYGNGWYRCILTGTIDAGDLSGALALDVRPSVASQFWPSAGDALGKSVFVWAFQAEAGSYATSYIPTLGASVTRSADVCSKTGVSGFIGQQEGVLYAEILRTQSTANDLFWITLSDGSINNWLFFGTEGTGGRFYVRASNTVIFDQYPAISLGRHKLALAYKSGSIAVYIDGAQLFTSSASFTIGSLTGFALGQNQSTLTGSVDTAGGVIASAVYPTRLTNAELAALTTL